MKICAATGNAGKLRELRRILEAQGHEVVSQKELGITIEPDETGTTFEANALIKAETICKASGLPTIADDSGLCVDALDGAPGVYSARYCGHHGDDEANNDKLLENMKDVPAGQRGASDPMGQMRVRRTGPWVKISCPFSWVQFNYPLGSAFGSGKSNIRK